MGYILSVFLVIILVIFSASPLNFLIELGLFLLNSSFKTYNKTMFTKVKIGFHNMIFNIKEIMNIAFLFKSILIYFFFVLIFIIVFSIVTSESNQKNYLNYKYKIIENYIRLSYFPEMVKIKDIENNEKDIVIIGYDSTYTYYYLLEYISDLLKNRGIKDSKDTENKYKEKPLSEIYAYYLNNISKDQLFYIKNTDYKLVNKIDKKYFEIEK